MHLVSLAVSEFVLTRQLVKGGVVGMMSFRGGQRDKPRRMIGDDDEGDGKRRRRRRRGIRPLEM